MTAVDSRHPVDLRIEARREVADAEERLGALQTAGESVDEGAVLAAEHGLIAARLRLVRAVAR